MCAVSYKKGNEPAISAFLQSFKLWTKLKPKTYIRRNKLGDWCYEGEFSGKQKLKWQKHHTFKTMQKTF